MIIGGTLRSLIECARIVFCFVELGVELILIGVLLCGY